MNGEIGLAFQAWLVGLATAGLVVLPGAVAFQGLFSEPFLETILQRLAGFVVLILPSLLMTFTIGALLSAPLFLLGLLVALAGRSLIIRHPWTMATLAPLLTMVIVAGISAWTRDNAWASAHSFAERFLWLIADRDTLIFALPVAAGSFWFCTQLASIAAEAEAG
jgi:hypothetical protein